MWMRIIIMLLIFVQGATAMSFDPTRNTRQVQALQLLSSKASNVLLEGGSRSGKTAILIHALIVRALKAPGSRHLIVRFRFNHAKQSVWFDTLPKILELSLPKEAQPTWNNSDFFLRFPNESEIWLGGLDDKQRTDKVLGNEYATVFFNECSQITFSSVETALSRLAQKTTLVPKAYYDQNPPSKKHWTYVLFHDKKNPEDLTPLKGSEDYAWMQMHPKHNERNIADGYIERVLAKLSVRKRKRFLDGEYSDDVEGALWNSDMISSTRMLVKPESLKRVCVSVDPAVSSNPDSNETGIITGGIDGGGHLYSWRDDTCIASPGGWARKAIAAYYEEEADAIVAEVNQGGDLVESNIKNIDKHVKVVQVRATRGKYKRAEPIAALMEADASGNYKAARDHIVGEMPDLESELTGWSPIEDEESPNRLDAHVWRGHWLLGTHKQAGTWSNRTPHRDMKIGRKFKRGTH